MDYSLLVGIHDPSVPQDAEMECNEDVEDDPSAYLSSDDLETPHSPSSTAG